MKPLPATSSKSAKSPTSCYGTYHKGYSPQLQNIILPLALMAEVPCSYSWYTYAEACVSAAGQ